jgi:hypothetical protein
LVGWFLVRTSASLALEGVAHWQPFGVLISLGGFLPLGARWKIMSKMRLWGVFIVFAVLSQTAIRLFGLIANCDKLWKSCDLSQFAISD